MNPYILLLDIGLSFLESFLNGLTHSQAPAQLIEAFRAAYAQLQAHKNDEVTKANLEAQRG